MIIKNKLVKFILLISISFFATLMNNAKNVSALNGSYSDPIIQKASLTAAITCYNAGRLKSTAGKLSDVTGPDRLFNTSSNSNAMTLDVFMPSGVSGLKMNQISCEGIFLGTSKMTDIFNSYWDKDIYGTYSGIFEGAGKPEYSDAITDPEKRVQFLTDMGYKQQGAKQCVYYSFFTDSEKTHKVYTDNICYKNNALYTEPSGGEGKARVIFFPHNEYFLDVEVGGNMYQDVASTIKGWDNFKRDLEIFISNTVVRDDDPDFIYDKENNNTHGDAWYTLPPSMPSGDLKVSPSDILTSFSTNGYRDLADLQFTDSEKLTYLIEALKNWIYKDKAIDAYQRCDISDFATNTKYKKINYNLTNGSVSDTCGVDSTSTSNDYIYWLNSSDLFDVSGKTKLYLDDIVFEINKLIDAGVIPSAITSSGENECLSSGAAENLGWIICPILNFASEQAQNLYSDLIEPALQIKPNLFGENNAQGGSTYQAWTIFQGFANTIFIIFFLFVIFSQVTGVGIDNYGIKKIMPKLIVTAILVNLSYIICQVCVDLSNIVGNGVQSIFNELSNNVTISATLNGVDIGAQIGSTMISAVGIAGTAYVAYLTWAVWLLPLLLGVIGAIISIIFLFILLAGRQAIVVLLVVISPLAFVCYLLPNTKKLFDKYIKIGEVMLLLYPICGLMVAGGGYVSKLLLSIPSGELDLFYTFTAMIVSIIPIFFIPKVVKSSFNALGSMGATLSGLGARLSGKAKSGIRNSGAYKAGQERLRENQTRWRAGIDKNGNPVKMTIGQRIARGSFSSRGIARNRAQYNKDQSARLAESLLLDSDYMANAAAHRVATASNEREKMYSDIYDRETDRGRVETALTDALAGKDAEKASAALLSLIKKGGISEAFGALSTTDWSAMDSNVRNRVVQAMGNSGVDAMRAYATYRNTEGKASFDNWAKGNVLATDSTAKTKNATYAQYLRQQKEHAIDNYGKDEMQFVSKLSSNLDTQMGNDYGRMIGSAMIHSNDAKAQAEVDAMVETYINNGNSAQKLGRSAEELSILRDSAAQAMERGYARHGGLTQLQSDLDEERTVIITTPQLYGKLKPEAKRIYDI